MCIFKNKHMKLIIKNDNRDIVKNPNVKIIETTEASFTNQTVFIEENDVPIIKYTDTESMYFVKDLDNLYDRKSKSEVLLDITIDNLETIGGGGSGGDFVPLTGTEVGNPVTGDIEISGESSLRTDIYTGVFISSNDDLVRLLRGETQIILDYEPYITVDAPASSQGLHGTKDFTGNITDLDYTQKKYVDQKVADSRPYKVYTALLSQTGANAPVATVLENTLGGDVVWSYEDVGDYLATLSGAFIDGKTYTIVHCPDNGYIAQIIRLDENEISLTITPSENTVSQSYPFAVEIRVYN